MQGDRHKNKLHGSTLICMYIHTITLTAISIQSVSSTTVASVGTQDVLASLRTLVSIQRALIDIYNEGSVVREGESCDHHQNNY